MMMPWRTSMAWLHTWAGVVFGVLLFVIFWMGTLSVFDREIDRWMMPETRFETPAQWRLDHGLLPVVEALSQQQELLQWGVTLPDARTPYARVFYQQAGRGFDSVRVDLERGYALPKAQTLGATGFIFPFHYNLHLHWRQLGIWLVGLAGMAMMTLLISGVIIHRKLFSDLLTFRPRKRIGRMTLDLHNLTGVAFLPFHVVITLSGLIIFMGIYYPKVGTLVYPGSGNPVAAFFADAGDGYQRPAAGSPASDRASLDAMVAQAESYWQDRVGYIRVFHASDRHAVVQLGRQVQGEVSWNIDKMFFDAASGELLHTSHILPMMKVQRFWVGLHFIQFDHTPLRWLYFIGGLASCVMIATGFIFWVKAREKRYLAKGVSTGRWVSALAAAGCLGLVLATVGWLLASVVLPAGFALGGWHKPALDVLIFALLWLWSCLHLLAVPLRRALVVQCRLLALVCVLAVVAQSWRSDGAWWQSLWQQQWAVMGTDLCLLVGAMIAWVAARRLARPHTFAAASAEKISC